MYKKLFKQKLVGKDLKMKEMPRKHKRSREKNTRNVIRNAKICEWVFEFLAALTKRCITSYDINRIAWFHLPPKGSPQSATYATLVIRMFQREEVSPICWRFVAYITATLKKPSRLTSTSISSVPNILTAPHPR